MSLWTAPLVVEESPFADLVLEDLEELLAEYEEKPAELPQEFVTPVTWETLMSTAD
jgi:hypothetical protein